jgi:hypothetical protein
MLGWVGGERRGGEGEMVAVAGRWAGLIFIEAAAVGGLESIRVCARRGARSKERHAYVTI